jgi:riboflavin synthase
MFTGLVECLGTVRKIESAGASKSITIDTPFAAELIVGESVNVDGACQSVVTGNAQSFTVVSIPETLKRTTLGSCRPGQQVNLERALRYSDRLGGHMVSGHIDCVGRVVKIQQGRSEHVIHVSFPVDYAALLVEKGSVAIGGVSLTVVDALYSQFAVAIIPHTLQETTLGTLHSGDSVNLEFDLVAKYLLRFKEVEHNVRAEHVPTDGRVTGE